MPTVSPCLIRSVGPAGDPEVSLGVPLLDEYLEFLSGRCRPNTVLAVAYDLKVFFTVVGKSPKRVRPTDVRAFMTAQRTGHGSAAETVQPVDGERCAGPTTRSSVLTAGRWRSATFWPIPCGASAPITSTSTASVG